jgi:transcriptional regulator with XRE-family HTH domain
MPLYEFNSKEKRELGMEDYIREAVKELHLGKKIRELRLSKGLSLQDMAETTGLSRPLLSQIEEEVAAPPIATLLKISHALDVSISYFFREEESRDKIVVIREQERQRVMRRVQEEGKKVGYLYQSLAYRRSEKHMEPFLVEFEPREREEMIFYNHKGEEFIFVLEGSLEFQGGDKLIVLNPGDSLYFDSDIPHAFRGMNGRWAKAIVVIYGP